MSFGQFETIKDCIDHHSDKLSPEGFASWLHKQVTGTFPIDHKPSSMPIEAWNTYLPNYSDRLDSGDSEATAHAFAVALLSESGWERSRAGYVRKYEAPKMRNVANVPIFSEGEWTDSEGTTRTWTVEDLQKMVAAFKAGIPLYLPLKAGHTSDDFNTRLAEELGVPAALVTGEMGQGQISLGKLLNMELVGGMIFGTFGGVPQVVADLIEGNQFRSVSAEIEEDVDGYGPVITGVALLGAELPAVDTAVLDRVGVFAKRDGAKTLEFAISGFKPKQTKIAVIGDKVKSAFEQFKKVFEDTQPVVTQTNLQEGNMDLAKLLAALGLQEGATEEDVLMAIEGLKQAAQASAEQQAPPAAMSAQFSDMKNTIKLQAEKISTLEEKDRFNEYLKTTKTFTSIEGDPEKMALEFAAMEQTIGKEATAKIVAQYAKANELAATALKVVGSEQAPIVETYKKHVFHTKVQEYADKNSISFQKALVTVKDQDKAGYNEWKELRRTPA